MLSRFPRPRTLLIVIASLIVSLLPGSGRCGWQTFRLTDGIADNSVLAISEDKAGDLWFATQNGVSRFDGVHWRTFTTTDGLPSYWVLGVTVDRAGNAWAATDRGVARFDGATWKPFNTGNLYGTIREIIQDRSGNMWFGAYDHFLGGVTRFDGTTYKTFTTADGLAGAYVSAIIEDPSGNIWIGTGSGVSRFDGAAWRTFTIADGLASNNVHTIALDASGSLWFGTPNGVTRFDGTTWRTFTVADGLVSDNVYAISADRWGNVWFGTLTGVSRFDGATWRTFTTADGLPANDVRAITQDRSGNLWFATSAGVSRFDGTSWSTFKFGDGPGANSVAAITTDRSGNVWFGFGYVGGASRFDGSTWTTFTPSDGLAQQGVGAIAADHWGDVWFGTLSDAPYLDGVSRFDGTRWTTFTTADGLADNDAHAIAEDVSGYMWFGSSGFGVSRFDGTGWRTYTSADGLASDVVQAIAADRLGNVWFGTLFAGVSRFDGSNWRSFSTADGLAGLDVRTIALDHSGSLWFGTNGFGASQFDGTSWRTFTAADGLASDIVMTAAVDQSGNIWFGTPAGASRFDGEDWVTYTTADGLVDNGVTAISEDKSGNMWFGTSVGITRYEPDRVAPRTVFEKVPPALSGSRNLSAVFVAAFGESRGVQFSSRLDGGPWSPWGPLGFWGGDAIPDGVHKLEVRSRDKAGNIDSFPATTTFEVDATPPAPIIASPLFAQPVRGAVEIRGTAADARFRQYRIDVRPAGAASWDPPAATTLIQSAIPVTDGTLANWNTSSLPDGNYELRLAVSDSLGLTGVAQVSVIVDNHAPYADVTAPATVSAASGGHVFTTNSELNLYFPPHAFLQDALVVIAPSTSAPDTLLSGAVRVLPAYDLSWGSSSLRKPATLEFSSAGRQPAPGALAIYFSPDGITWQRLGGTAEPQKVSLAVENPGRYALFSEKSLWSGSGHLSSLSLTPRVFSLADRFADDQVAIGFSLGRAAPVTVRIYNRAGRLVRSLVEGEPMGAGENLVRWNGTDRADVRVADGIYLVTVEALGETRRNTIAVVR